jgi:hypothetical protein
MHFLFVFALAVMAMQGSAQAEIISCPTEFSPLYKDCTVFQDPLLRPKKGPQKCDRSDCRPAVPSFDETGRKVCVFTCFRRFEQ